MWADIKSSANTDSSLTLSMSFSMSTSQDSGLPSGHLFVTPALTVKFSETRIISYNTSSCSADEDTIITWALGKDAGNLKSFTLKAYTDITDSEVRS